MLGTIGVFLCGAPFKSTPHYARRIHLSCKSQSFGKQGCAAQKRGFACASNYSAREICFKLLKQISTILGKTRTVFPSRLVATRRRRAGGAHNLPLSPRALVAPLHQKSHSALLVAIFGDPAFLRAHHKHTRRFHPFRKARDCQIEGKKTLDTGNFAERPLAGIYAKIAVKNRMPRKVSEQKMRRICPFAAKNLQKGRGFPCSSVLGHRQLARHDLLACQRDLFHVAG